MTGFEIFALIMCYFSMGYIFALGSLDDVTDIPNNDFVDWLPFLAKLFFWPWIITGAIALGMGILVVMTIIKIHGIIQKRKGNEIK
jgi:hypothetical protein